MQQQNYCRVTQSSRVGHGFESRKQSLAKQNKVAYDRPFPKTSD